MINVYVDPEIQGLFVAQQWNALAAHPDLHRSPELVVEVAARFGVDESAVRKIARQIEKFKSE